jgi:hypothetical protein
MLFKQLFFKHKQLFKRPRKVIFLISFQFFTHVQKTHQIFIPFLPHLGQILASFLVQELPKDNQKRSALRVFFHLKTARFFWALSCS